MTSSKGGVLFEKKNALLYPCVVSEKRNKENADGKEERGEGGEGASTITRVSVLFVLP